MCTAVTFCTKDHYFGRTLDLEHTYGEQVVVTPRKFPLTFRRAAARERHYAMIGMAHVAENYPLYYDAVNEAGLAMAGLNFPHSCGYGGEREGRHTIAPFELIPWVLSRCETVEQARTLLQCTDVASIPFSKELPATPLHWLVEDRDRALVVEPVGGMLELWDDPVGVLSNEPPFPHQMTYLSRYMGLSAGVAENRFAPGLELDAISRGLGAVGLPGDWSSPSRFVRAAFLRGNSVCGNSEEESVSQFFHILGGVEQTRGCNRLKDGACVVTQYTSCCNADRGIYYYTTYGNRSITGVNMFQKGVDGDELITFSLETKEKSLVPNNRK